jgi:hypothetical protein
VTDPRGVVDEVAVTKRKNTRKQSRFLLSQRSFLQCFNDALKLVTALKPGNSRSWQLNRSEHDPRLTLQDAAENDFYSSFEFRRDGTMVYILTRAFFDYIRTGFKPTAEALPGEARHTLLLDCATNYLVKNFWHNIVHEQMQHITSSNYRQVRDEGRYSSDFEADCLATVLLALSYGHTVRADCSDQVAPPDSDLQRLFLRNRSNRVFELRETARRKRSTAHKPHTVDDLYEIEWLIRRRLINELCIRCLERGRALASVSVHFFGPLKGGLKGRYERPEAYGVVEMNGIRVPLGKLGDFAYLPRAEIRTAVESYATSLDNDYAELLRSNPQLKAYANRALEAKVRRLVGCRLSNGKAGLRVLRLQLTGGSAARKRRRKKH